jgi:hypothetical protein
MRIWFRNIEVEIMIMSLTRRERLYKPSDGEGKAEQHADSTQNHGYHMRLWSRSRASIRCKCWSIAAGGGGSVVLH